MLRRVFSVVVVVVVTFIILEISVRGLFPHAAPVDEEDALYHYTEQGPRMRPNKKARTPFSSISNRSVVVQTNSLGLRGPEPVRGLPAIAFLGDSITEADYIDEEDTYSALVREELGRRAEYQVINAGITGQGLAHEVAFLKDLLNKDIKIQVLFLQFYLNDATGCCHLNTYKAPSAFSWSRFVQKSFEVYSLQLGRMRRYPIDMHEDIQNRVVHELSQLASSSSSNEDKAFYNRAAREHIGWGNMFSPLTWDYLKEVFQELRSIQEKHGFRLVVLSFPTRAQLEAEREYLYPQHQLAQIAESFNWPLIDFYKSFRSYAPKDIDTILYDSCHPTPYGHKIVADTIYQFLEESIL